MVPTKRPEPQHSHRPELWDCGRVPTACMGQSYSVTGHPPSHLPHLQFWAQQFEGFNSGSSGL